MHVVERESSRYNEMENTWFIQNYKIDTLGSKLNLEIDCPIYYYPINKGAFVCDCGIIFAIDELSNGNWENIKYKHNEGCTPAF